MLRPLLPISTALAAVVFSLFQPAPALASTFLLHTVSGHGTGGYNNLNPGLGIRSDSGLTLGAYCNSESRSARFPGAKVCQPSAYLGQHYDWNLVPGVRFGLTGGVLVGYSRAQVLPFVLPSLLFGDHLRVLFAPAIEPKGVSAVSLVLEF
jgi:hypothetical protein